MTDPAKQNSHDTMVQVKSILLKFEKYDDIRANLSSNPDKPAPIYIENASRELIPDITAMREKLTIFEVETPDSIQSNQTHRNWIAIARFCEENDAVFRIVVTKGYAGEVQTRLDELQIKAQIEEVIDTN